RAADVLYLPNLGMTGIGGRGGRELVRRGLAPGGDLRDRAGGERVEERDGADIVALRRELLRAHCRLVEREPGRVLDRADLEVRAALERLARLRAPVALDRLDGVQEMARRGKRLGVFAGALELAVEEVLEQGRRRAEPLVGLLRPGGRGVGRHHLAPVGDP